MQWGNDIGFNPAPSGLMHIDINSCFASVEQQANFHYRHRPLVVAAYNIPSACIIAASVEAKKLGIKVGLRVKEGRDICPDLIICEPDPDKYRHVHHALKKLLLYYTDNIRPKSIDEFVLKFDPQINLIGIGGEIKERIKKEVGDYLTVSIGLGPNRFLAKTASNLHKPDGLDEINISNFEKVYSGLKLTDLCGIKRQSALLLNQVGIFTLLDFYRAPSWQLKSAFHSVIGYYWYLRLRGWEIDDYIQKQRGYGQSFVMAKSVVHLVDTYPVLQKLTEKMAYRLRSDGYQAHTVDLAITYQDHTFWHHSISFREPIFDSRDFFKKYLKILYQSPPNRAVKKLAISCSGITRLNSLQLDLFGAVSRKFALSQSLDKISRRWGKFVVVPANMAHTQNLVPDRIAFGNIDIPP
jgi:DNA polymerase-4